MSYQNGDTFSNSLALNYSPSNDSNRRRYFSLRLILTICGAIGLATIALYATGKITFNEESSQKVSTFKKDETKKMSIRGSGGQPSPTPGICSLLYDCALNLYPHSRL
jgi:hypothetical protein